MAIPEDQHDATLRPILRLLPVSVVNSIRDRFYAGITAAELRFRFNSADEDALTGALAQALIEPETMLVRTEQGVFGWRATSHKLRGRGRGAPESRIGADGIFQLEVFNMEGELILKKGLLFQSKVDWTGTDQRLLGQARMLLLQSESSIVIDYTKDGYQAIPASEVVAAGGNRRQIATGSNKELSEVLGDEFVGCLVGDQGMFWDSERERLITHRDQPSDLVPSRLISMDVRRLQ
jgi:hypothetical protein